MVASQELPAIGTAASQELPAMGTMPSQELPATGCVVLTRRIVMFTFAPLPRSLNFVSSTYQWCPRLQWGTPASG